MSSIKLDPAFTDAFKQALAEQAAAIMREAKLRKPYVSEDECDDYLASRTVQQVTIDMRKRADGV